MNVYSATLAFMYPALGPSGGRCFAAAPRHVAETVANAMPDAQFHIAVHEFGTSRRTWHYRYKERATWAKQAPE